MDGSQPKKPEKDLVYGKVVIRWKAVELLLKCIHMNDFGGTADDLKNMVDTRARVQHNKAVRKQTGISLC